MPTLNFTMTTEEKIQIIEKYYNHEISTSEKEWLYENIEKDTELYHISQLFKSLLSYKTYLRVKNKLRGKYKGDR